MLLMILFELALPWSTIALVLLSSALAGMTGWQFFNKESKRRLKEEIKLKEEQRLTATNAAIAAETTRDAWDHSLTLVRADRDRLLVEIQAKAARIGELEARTNLEGLSAQMNQHHQEMLLTFQRENSETKLEIVQMLQKITKEIMSGFSEHAKHDLEQQVALHNLLETRLPATAAG